MDAIKLFEAALDIRSPWSIAACEFSAEERQLVMRMEFAEGSRFACPACQAAGCPVHDTKPQRWRHLDFFQHKAFIEAKVPRVRCAACGCVRMVDVPWARKNSGFTLLMGKRKKGHPLIPIAQTCLPPISATLGKAKERKAKERTPAYSHSPDLSAANFCHIGVRNDTR